MMAPVTDCCEVAAHHRRMERRYERESQVGHGRVLCDGRRPPDARFMVRAAEMAQHHRDQMIGHVCGMVDGLPVPPLPDGPLDSLPRP